MSTTEYVLGTDKAELHRLGFQHRLWSDLAQRSWSDAGIAPGQHVLDVGSGPGFATLDIASIVGPEGRVVAVDESRPFLDVLAGQARVRGDAQVHTLVGDAQKLDTLPLEPASFDIAYARWVLCFVPDPASVLRGVARLLKPGGRLVVNDYFNYEAMSIAPKHPAFTRAIHAVGRSWRDRGGDPDIVGRLSSLAVQAGMTPSHLKVEQRVARPGDTMWHWPDTFWRNFIPRLVSSGHLSEGDSREFFEVWERASADPCSFMLMPSVFEFIARRG